MTMRGGPLMLAALAAFPAMAQDAADKARLDEFALPGASEGVSLEQLDPDASTLPQAAPPAGRDVSAPGSEAGEPPETLVVSQLASTGERGASAQVSEPPQSRDTAPASISSSADSRPEGVTRLAGQDRCDPQADAADDAECRRILELRASEFQAAEAPRMSAEQALLASRGESAAVLAATSSDLRLRIVGGTAPDAQTRANQELAAIYRATAPDTAPPRTETQPDPALPEGWAEAIEQMQQQASIAGQP